MNGVLLLLFSATMLAFLTLCADLESPSPAETSTTAVVAAERHECLGEDDCKVMVLRRQLKSLQSVSDDARRRGPRGPARPRPG